MIVQRKTGELEGVCESLVGLKLKAEYGLREIEPKIKSAINCDHLFDHIYCTSAVVVSSNITQPGQSLVVRPGTIRTQPL